MTGLTAIRPLAMPSEAVKLNLTFDAERLLDELLSVRTHTWDAQRMYDKNGIGAATEADWRCLALRAPGGDGTRTDPGGPGPEDYADTPWLAHMPYYRELLAGIPAPLHTVRLMALGPGAVGIEHHDPKYGPRWGVTRLHVPIVTNADAVLMLDGVEHRWQPGDFWFGDFSRRHYVANHGSEHRIHLVIDTLVTPSLAGLFPDQWADYFGLGDILYTRAERPLTEEERRSAGWTIEIPETFLLWEDAHDLHDGSPRLRATIAETAGQLFLVEPAGARLALVHLGSNEYRFAGWSEERTLQLFLHAHQPHAVLRVREGRSAQQLAVPVEPSLLRVN
ncbi:aspartyl/asparaginyl beta-hydroxylase domain-containing protein [Burkholderia glumae]|uniref:aspartyl/asparaginyl beta-hydroxylase domain-containing protein n=1 Tax=Burkholderia glumae TaxID=337 RepID=UPI00031FF57F|nr:aspartyl/asparaginyl beta-hydroxylase domain-containing protein [Burkholderia glumae]MCM2494904.1 aspartyl/asparaginyl beta-hydroxylase domain-containing protein [Burkholderia glumae]MCM2545769.1 aspartyl/asparaginyl beta-hydroxylase domain-containing protein [Burkholderia glumae]PJO22570.1 aspartyl/asparaginyl beta-hydroxylase domain-containing protein [Burkholderia glumae AU6208]QHE13759.1 aspartyl/asparaginyl beta-hydroxylase domain-containing protein [Burkholderia glumae AU6208]